MHTHHWNQCAECGAIKPIKGFPPEDVARLIEMNKTMTLKEISAAEGRSAYYVQRAIRGIGQKPVDHRSGPHRERNYGKVSETEYARRYAVPIRMYRDEGLTLAQIGEQFNVSRERVRQWFVLAGLTNLAKDRTKARRTRRIAAKEAWRDEEVLCPRGCGETISHRNMKQHWDDVSHQGNLLGTRDAARYWEGAAADYAAGMKTKDICEKWDIDPGSLMRAVDGHGIPHRRPNQKRAGNLAMIEARKERIRSLNRRGYTVTETASIEQCSDKWVYMVLRAAGLPLNHKRRSA